MQYLYVTDQALADRLQAAGAYVLQKRTDMALKPVWVFGNLDALPVCFDIQQEIQKGTCTVRGQLTMCF
jgi:hypothetical protein